MTIFFNNEKLTPSIDEMVLSSSIFQTREF